MKLKFYKPKELERTFKVSIQKTGKMGFTKDAADKLGLEYSKTANIGRNEDDPQDDNLYLVIYKDASEGEFRVQKAGSYYYINTKILFDNLKIDYADGKTVYEMSKEADGEQVYYKLSLIKKPVKEPLIIE